MVDLFVLLVAPGGGDELQGIKRGIIELADLVVVNKADGDLAPAARSDRRRLRQRAAARAVEDRRRGRHAWCSSRRSRARGIDELWDAVEEFRAALGATGRPRAPPRRPGARLDVVGGHRDPHRVTPPRRARIGSRRAASKRRSPPARSRRPRLPARSSRRFVLAIELTIDPRRLAVHRRSRRDCRRGTSGYWCACSRRASRMVRLGSAQGDE